MVSKSTLGTSNKSSLIEHLQLLAMHSGIQGSQAILVHKVSTSHFYFPDYLKLLKLQALITRSTCSFLLLRKTPSAWPCACHILVGQVPFAQRGVKTLSKYNIFGQNPPLCFLPLQTSLAKRWDSSHPA